MYECKKYLASGNTFTDLHYTYRMGISTISGIVEQVCDSIWNLKVECMPTLTEEKWITIASEFGNITNFPNCIGALDGKHVRVIKPMQSGSLFYNYKHYYSIVLMAICDANYCFTYVDIGAQGKYGDSSVFRHGMFYKKLENDSIPNQRPLPGDNTNQSLPFVIVADEVLVYLDLFKDRTPGVILTTKRKYLTIDYQERDDTSSQHLGFYPTSGEFYIGR
ncbi:uncharacterized protein LOC132936770 [Metopolophium dirhodum]|uniref:uncharacterized protein LOC132936770 n=1 Tax=Metopolophium dirhodum TaxID=44670 RepID=UPI00298F7C52|nr:uncharacterized protein LOC132936770 [Metopolophium dirhodum]